MAATSQESASHLGNGKGMATGVAQPAWSGGAGVCRDICASLPNVHSADGTFPLETFNIPVSAGENQKKGGVSDEQARSYSLFSSLKPGEWSLLPASLSSLPGTSFSMPVHLSGEEQRANTPQAHSARGCRSCTLRGRLTLSLGTDAVVSVLLLSMPHFFLFLFSHPHLNSGCAF